ncbi:oxalate:formate antiporter [Paraburkholderia sp. NMBU_R16]|nr:oxalate:formate antiporter [Paraburkholderia sp. NMBU_R16]NRO95612.1 oxalate:formate antiporter [Paraburkholderia sp. NMBU_R16]
MNETSTAVTPSSRIRLIVFWAYVLIPLAWGVINTLRQALKLFV